MLTAKDYFSKCVSHSTKFKAVHSEGQKVRDLAPKCIVNGEDVIAVVEARFPDPDDPLHETEPTEPVIRILQSHLSIENAKTLRSWLQEVI